MRKPPGGQVKRAALREIEADSLERKTKRIFLYVRVCGCVEWGEVGGCEASI